MKIVILIMLFTPIFAESQTDAFEVREVPADRLTKLHDAQAKVEVAILELDKAKKAADAAQAAEKVATEAITMEYNPYKTNCNGAGQQRLREVEIRGKYALITDKIITCNELFYVGGSINLTNDSLSDVVTK